MRWSIARKPSTIKGLACALFSDKGIESRKASGRLKVEHPFLIVKRRFGPLKEALQEDKKTSCTLESFSPLQTLPCASFAGRLHLPALSVA
jgi:hypothetical protein